MGHGIFIKEDISFNEYIFKWKKNNIISSRFINLDIIFKNTLNIQIKKLKIPNFNRMLLKKNRIFKYKNKKINKFKNK